MVLRLNKRSLVYVFLSVLFVLLTVRYAFQVEIPRIVLTGILILISLFGDRDDIIAIIMGCIPLNQAVDFFLVLVACAAMLVLKNPHKVKIGIPMLLIAVMIIWELLHCFFYKWTPNLLLIALVPLIFIGVFLSVDLSDVDYNYVVRVMAVISLIISIIQLLIVVVRSDGDLVRAVSALGRLGVIGEDETLIGGALNSNSIGIINALSMTALLQIRPADKNKITNIILFISLLLFGVLTLSRTFLVCLAIMLFLLIFNNRRNLINSLKILGGALASVFSIIFIANWIFPDAIKNYVGRFMVDDITTGRIDIMGLYNSFIIENPNVMFFGIGLSDFKEKVLTIYKAAIHVPHNGFQEIIVAWGILGLIMFLGLIAAMIIESNKYNRCRRLINYIPLVIILVKSMAGQLITSGYTLLALAFAYLSLCQDFNSNKNESN